MAKIIVVGGTGNIGARVVEKLRAHGHDAVAASRHSGVDAYTGEGLAEAFAGADVVVDTTQAPSFASAEVHDYFTTSTAQMLAAGKAAGVGHHVVLTIVGTDRPQDIDFFHAKAAQEKLVRESGIPFTLVHASQFFDFAPAVVFTGTDGDEIRVSDALIQPIAADDVATATARAAAGAPAGDIEIAGPEAFPIAAFVQQWLAAEGDERAVVESPESTYFGAVITERTLLPVDGAQIFSATFADWLKTR